MVSTKKQGMDLGSNVEDVWARTWYLCLVLKEVETISHMVIHCPYAQQLWKDVYQWTFISNVWVGNSVEDCLKA